MSKESQMSIFAQTVKDGSFSEAARSLHLTPSAISKQISALEDRLGVRLLNRTTRKLNLTEAGARYLEHTRRILSEIEEAESEVGSLRDSPRGVLRVNGPVVMGARRIAPLIREFEERYPEVKIELNLNDHRVDLMETGEDVALRIGDELFDSSMIARKLCPIRRIIYASPDYLEKYGEPKKPEDLLKHNCLTYNEPDYLNDWPFINCPGPKLLRVSGNFVSNNGEAQHYAALNGLGIARLATLLSGEKIKSGEIIELLRPYEPPSRTYFWAIYPQNRYVAPKLRVFIDYLLEKLNPIPPWDQYET
ncbi:LysR substrate-binding domain-containing protein [Terasakiella sp. A23]|uniref:LysR family transcriptional regulator n=1 Tax=Terasakiella sp. FCG-A23 TaxID=3080561 RepID=UPI002955794A|nr:LysR substrate-binding domain-containing protein [Terasakiella sp. A23]MDV7340053.1 LysR substrate-binding domain-containing protein [Terasakiella sp. A23]